MNLQPYLFFDGRCEEALDFYKKAIGAQVEVRDALEGLPRQERLHAAEREQGDALPP